jgi:hypothetical protein
VSKGWINFGKDEKLGFYYYFFNVSTDLGKVSEFRLEARNLTMTGHSNGYVGCNQFHIYSSDELF